MDLVKVRTVEQFEEYAGINFKLRAISTRL